MSANTGLDGVRPPAFLPLPPHGLNAVLAPPLGVIKDGAVRLLESLEAAVESDLFGRTAGGWHFVDLVAAGTIRFEINPLPVARPGGLRFRGFLVRQPPPGPAGRADHVNVAVSADVRIKRDPLTVGRPARRACGAALCGEACRVVAASVAHPQLLSTGASGNKDQLLSIGRKVRAVLFVNRGGRKLDGSAEWTRLGASGETGALIEPDVGIAGEFGPDEFVALPRNTGRDRILPVDRDAFRRSASRGNSPHSPPLSANPGINDFAAIAGPCRSEHTALVKGNLFGCPAGGRNDEKIRFRWTKVAREGNQFSIRRKAGEVVSSGWRRSGPPDALPGLRGEQNAAAVFVSPMICSGPPLAGTRITSYRSDSSRPRTGTRTNVTYLPSGVHTG